LSRNAAVKKRGMNRGKKENPRFWGATTGAKREPIKADRLTIKENAGGKSGYLLRVFVGAADEQLWQKGRGVAWPSPLRGAGVDASAKKTELQN